MGTSIRQTETDRNRHAVTSGHSAWDHAKNTSLMKESWRYREREGKRERPRERERD